MAYVGIEGGGTRSTAIVLGEDGEQLARVEGAPGLVPANDPVSAGRTLVNVAREALATAGLRPPVEALVCALAGAGRAAAREPLAMALRGAGVARHIAIVTDAEGAMHDAFGEGPGILLISGTGSVAWGRAADGRTARAGGWGLLIGDEGSGYHIAVEAMRAVARATDGRGPETALQKRLIRTVGSGSPEELIPWAARGSKGTIASLAPHVAELAATDAVAREIIDASASHLARHFFALHDRLEPWDGGAPLALGGGLLFPGRPLRDLVLSAIRGAGHEPAVIDRAIDGARGAAALARAMTAPR
jgi:glucosamine kinase